MSAAFAHLGALRPFIFLQIPPPEAVRRWQPARLPARGVRVATGFQVLNHSHSFASFAPPQHGSPSAMARGCVSSPKNTLHEQ